MYCKLLLPYTPVLARVEDLAAAVTPYWPFRAIKHTMPFLNSARRIHKQTNNKHLAALVEF